MKFYLPFRPFLIGQKWGVKNPAYEQFGFSRHNGVDATPLHNPVHGSKHPIYCPVEGFRVSNVRFIEKGGGLEIWLTSKEKMQIGELECYAQIIFMHNDRILVPVGYEPALGELICIGDNTGFSTGQHTHIALYRVDYRGRKLDANEANGSYDPEVFFQNQYAIDKATWPVFLKSALRLAAYYTKR